MTMVMIIGTDILNKELEMSYVKIEDHKCLEDFYEAVEESNFDKHLQYCKNYDVDVEYEELPCLYASCEKKWVVMLINKADENHMIELIEEYGIEYIMKLIRTKCRDVLYDYDCKDSVISTFYNEFIHNMSYKMFRRKIDGFNKHEKELGCDRDHFYPIKKAYMNKLHFIYIISPFNIINLPTELNQVKKVYEIMNYEEHIKMIDNFYEMNVDYEDVVELYYEMLNVDGVIESMIKDNNSIKT